LEFLRRFCQNVNFKADRLLVSGCERSWKGVHYYICVRAMCA